MNTQISNLFDGLLLTPPLFLILVQLEGLITNGSDYQETVIFMLYQVAKYPRQSLTQISLPALCAIGFILLYTYPCCDVTIGLSHRSCSMSSWMKTSCRMPVNTSLITWRPTGEPHTLLKWNLPTPCWRNWQKTHSPPAPHLLRYWTHSKNRK